MRIPRIYSPQAFCPGSAVSLEPAAAHHIHRVLRLRAGSALTVFNGDGRDYRAELKASGQLVILEASAEEREPALHLTLLQGIAKGERMDWIVQKAVELGVQRIVPLVCERSVVRLDGDRLSRRMEHWRQIVLGACEQSGRRRLPTVETALPIRRRLIEASRGLRLVLSPPAEQALVDVRAAPDAVALLIGPEGGLSGDELAFAERCGFLSARLGPRVLRTETAALAAIASVQALWGDFRG